MSGSISAPSGAEPRRRSPRRAPAVPAPFFFARTKKFRDAGDARETRGTRRHRVSSAVFARPLRPLRYRVFSAIAMIGCGWTRGLAVAPGGLAAAGVARRQRHPRLESFELDAGARTGAQQPVGRLAQRGAGVLGIAGERGVEGGEKRADIGGDAVAQFLIDKGGAVLAPRRFRLGVGIGVAARRHGRLGTT